MPLSCHPEPMTGGSDRALEPQRANGNHHATHGLSYDERAYPANQPLQLAVSQLPIRRLHRTHELSDISMDDEFPFAAMHPTAGYLFAEELDIHFLALDDFRSTILLDDNNFIQPSSLSSPSSVVYLPPCYPSSPYKFVTPKDCNVFIKPEPIDHPMAKLEPLPIPVRVIRDDTAEKERLRCRQRGYEKRYRGRKRRDLKLQRDTWLALEIELDATRKKYCRPYVRVEHGEGRDTLRYKLLLLKLEERALQQDHVALRSLQAWESISRIREYSDKDELRTVSEWRHSADKVIGRCSALGPQRFHPYAPLEQRHFTW